jgi:lambda repressor-like predicted transcriptional regulator
VVRRKGECIGFSFIFDRRGIMDILDIVNNFIKSKTEINPETIINKLNNGESLESIIDEYYISKDSLLKTLKESGYIYNQSTLKWVKPTPANIPINTLYEIVSEMFINNYDISLVSNKYTIPKEELIKELEYKKFRKRWSYIGESSTQKITHKLKSYLYQLNTLKEDIEELAEYESLTVSEIQEQLTNADYREIWMLEEVIAPPFVISTVNDERIIYDINTGEPIVLKVNGRSFFTMKQVSKVLDINSKYVYYRHKDEFKKDNHYIDTKDFFCNNQNIFKAVPHTDYLRNEILFTDSGLYYFSFLTNSISSYRQKIKEIEDIQSHVNEAIEVTKIPQDKKIEETKISLDKQIEDILIPEHKIATSLHNDNNEPLNETEIIDDKNDVFDNSSSKNNELNVESIVGKLNMNIGIATIARDLKTQIGEINKILRDEGYRFDSFFELWTKESEKKLITNALIELNNGITLYDLSGRYIVNRKQRILFADELRRKIEALGYKLDQKSKKWKTAQELVVKKQNHEEILAPKIVQQNHSIENKKDNSSYQKNISGKEISDKLNKGMSLRQIEEETGIDSTKLRITLKNEGYRYEGLFKTWINVERKDLLDKIEEEISSNRSTFEDISKSFNIDKSELEKQLRVYGYKLDKSIPQKELEVIKEKEEPEVINNKIDPDSANEPRIGFKLSEEEYQLLKEILIERKNFKEEREGIKGLKIYLSSNLLEKLEDYTEVNNSSRSSFIEKAIEHYLTFLK